MKNNKRFAHICPVSSNKSDANPMRFTVWSCLVVAFIMFSSAIMLFGQTQDDRLIHSVTIQGLENVSESVVLANVNSREGATFSEKQVSDDARRLIVMPEIYDVKWKVTEADGQVDLIFYIKETNRIKDVIILGNKSLKTEKLLKELQFKKDEFLDLYLVNLGAEDLANYYHEKGYYFATVKLNQEKLEEDNTVVFVVVEGPKLRIKKVNFIGNEQVKARKLKGKAKTKPYFPIFRKGDLDDEQIERDRQAIEAYYHEEGYLDARVFARTVFNDDKTEARIRFVIEEGPQYRVASIRFEGNTLFTEEELLSEVSLEPGQVFTEERQTLAKKSLTRAYGRQGYLYARTVIELQYTATEGDVDAVFKIHEDKQYNLGRIHIRGNYQTRDKVIRRTLDRHEFLPGGVYDTEAVEKAKTRLEGLGLFEDVSILPTGEEPDERDALVEIREARTGMLIFGVNVDTQNGVMGQFSIEQRNFDIGKWPTSMSDLLGGNAFIGAGQRLRLNFEPGTRVTRGRLSFHEPYLFDTTNYLDTDLFMFRRWRDFYLERRQGGNLTIGHRFKNDWYVDGTFRAERVDVADLDWTYKRLIDDNGTPNDKSDDVYVVDQDGHFLREDKRTIIAPQDCIDVEGRNILTSFRLGVGRDTTDRYFRPTEGYKIGASVEQLGVLGGDYDYTAIGAFATKFVTIYQDVTERKTVWASQVRANKMFGDTPLFERYYAGGIGSLRGFDYRGISPRQGDYDDVIGSDYMVLAGTEISHPLFEETVYGKLFCDTGFVSEGPYRVSVGFGLEILVPQLFQMVPMQFNFGFPVISDDKDDEQLFSFSFGVSF